jgi:NADPH-dependent ferric siderophore reductase
MTLLHSSSVELASRLGATAAVAQVEAMTALSAGVAEVTLRVDDAAHMAGVPGNDVMVRLGGREGHQIRRRYSVRAVDPDLDTISLWVGIAHDGVGAQWARDLVSGAQIDVIGPRGKIPVDRHAEWHLFVGDTTGLGAFARMAESLAPPARVAMVVEVEDMSDALVPSVEDPGRASVVFAQRRGSRPGDPRPLLDALGLVDLPAGPGHAYLFGELGAMHASKSALLDRGFDERAIDLKPFWRAGVPNQEHGEPPKG